MPSIICCTATWLIDFRDIDGQKRMTNVSRPTGASTVPVHWALCYRQWWWGGNFGCQATHNKLIMRSRCPWTSGRRRAYHGWHETQAAFVWGNLFMPQSLSWTNPLRAEKHTLWTTVTAVNILLGPGTSLHLNSSSANCNQLIQCSYQFSEVLNVILVKKAEVYSDLANWLCKSNQIETASHYSILLPSRMENLLINCINSY